MDFISYTESQNAFLTYYDRLDYLKTHNDRKLFEKLQPYRSIQWPHIYEAQPDIYGGVDILADEEMKAKLLENIDYFVSHLMNFFELSDILAEVNKFTNARNLLLVEDMKSLVGIMRKLFIRGKGLNDMVRCMMLTINHEDFLALAEVLARKYNVALKTEKSTSSWPIPKLLVWARNKSIEGKVATLEIQFCSHDVHNMLKCSSNHKVYEDLRESSSYYAARSHDRTYTGFLQALNKRPHVRRQIMDNLIETVGGFAQKEASNGSRLKITGEIKRFIDCQGIAYEKFPPTAANSLSSYLVDGSLTVIEQQSLWSTGKHNLTGKRIEFIVSYADRGSVFLGLGENMCYHGRVNGYALTLMLDANRIWVRDGFFAHQLHYEGFNSGDQDHALIIFEKLPGKLRMTLNLKNAPAPKVFTVPCPDLELRVFVTSWAGCHHSRIHDIAIKNN